MPREIVYFVSGSEAYVCYSIKLFCVHKHIGASFLVCVCVCVCVCGGGGGGGGGYRSDIRYNEIKLLKHKKISQFEKGVALHFTVPRTMSIV